MSILIRPAVPSDPHLQDVPGELGMHRLVAVDDTTSFIVGEVFIHDPDDDQHLLIKSLFVSEGHRRRGAGMELVCQAALVVSAHGRKALATVGASQDDAAQLFHRAGWTAAPELGPRVFVSHREQTPRKLQPETIAVHAGMPDDELGPVTAPISVSSTYRASHPGTYGRWAYARTSNPTRHALEVALAELDGGAGAGAFASGLAAIDALMRLLKPKSKIVVSNDVYGGTWRLLSAVWDNFEIEVVPVDLTDQAAAESALKGAAMLIVETPSNPLLRVLDIETLSAAAHANGAISVVDNTFATAYLQKPIDFGADYVVYSTTKYVGGHSDVIGGAIIAKTQDGVDKIKFLQRAVGAVASPFDSFLVLRGIRTLALRMERASENAERIATELANHADVASVFYPGFPDNPGHAVAQRQMRTPGAMVSFRHAGGKTEAYRMCQRTQLFTLAESLGAVESLIELPAAMTHAAASGSLLEVPDDLIRLSVGIEHVDDQLADLFQAFESP